VPELKEELKLAGAAPDEAVQLAALLERAAEPARIDVPPAEIERALARVSPRRRRAWTRPGIAAAAAAAAAIVVALLVLPSRQQSVQARAVAALGDENTVLHVREIVTSTLGGETRDVWFDPARGRARWTELAPDNTVIAETLVEPGRFDREIAGEVHITGRSCSSIAAGCSELLDPVSRYREVLRDTHVRAVRSSFAGRRTYRLVLPLQAGLQQVAYVDAETFLPRRLEWVERGSVVSTIDITDVRSVPRANAPPSAFARPEGGRVVAIAPAGKLDSVRRLTLAQARALRPFWLGARGLRSFVQRRYANGSLVVARYSGDLEVWTYDRAVPVELLAPRLQETKTLDVDGKPATFFEAAGRAVVVRDGSPSVAVVERFATKEEIFGAFGRVERLR